MSHGDRPIRATPDGKQHLAELAEKTGDETVRDVVNTYLERSAKKSEPNGAPTTKQAHQIWEKMADITRGVPEEEFRKPPHDGAEHIDHYIYGTPKRSQ